MRKNLIVAFTLLSFFFLSSCENDAKEIVTSNNTEFKVELLFETDGCKVYRFYDGVRPRYFSNCKGSVDWNETHGKSNVDVEVNTNVVK